MTVERADYNGDVNIGFFGVVTGAFTLVADGFDTHGCFADTDTETVKLAGTDLVGIFAAGNANGLLVPDIITDHEEDVLDDTGIDYRVLESTHTALGNLVLCNDSGAYISRELDPVSDVIAEVLDVPVTVGTVAGLDIVGSCGVATDGGVLLHRDASEAEAEAVEDALDVDADVGTVNFGTPFVHSGVLADTENVLVGDDTTGPEVQRVQEALDLL
ncbi:MAG: translation initiation factor IF-6 [Candidatus Nanohaloarchaea archaeon]|nr:translation initiation factor IF-6 [Candidatus Nanohaloarchaea archaeon]